MRIADEPVALRSRFVMVEGREGESLLDYRRAVVTKQFRSHHGIDAEQRAEREFLHLQLLKEALEPYPLIRCPQPIALGGAGELTMSLLDGTSLTELIFVSPAPRLDDVAALGSLVGQALRVCGAITGEPIYDIGPQHILYLGRGQGIGLIDIGEPAPPWIAPFLLPIQRLVPDPGLQSAALFVAIAVRQSLGLRNGRAMHYAAWRVAQTLCVEVLLSFGRLKQPDIDGVAAIARLRLHSLPLPRNPLKWTVRRAMVQPAQDYRLQRIMDVVAAQQADVRPREVSHR
jgi:hypothetical protein